MVDLVAYQRARRHLVEELGEVFSLALRGARFEAGHLLFDDGVAPVEPRMVSKN